MGKQEIILGESWGDIVDKVRNPWNKRKGVIVFDIETSWLNGKSEKDKRRAKFRCGVAYVYDKNSFVEFTQPRKFVEFIKRAKTLVSYNGEGFDFFVLRKYGLKLKSYRLRLPPITYNQFFDYIRFSSWLANHSRWKPQRIQSYDIMYMIQEKLPKWHKDNKYPSLEEMINQHYHKNKAPYESEDIRQLLDHCREDVEYTKKLYEESIWTVPVMERKGTQIGTENSPVMLCPLCNRKLAMTYEGVELVVVRCRRCGWAEPVVPLEKGTHRWGAGNVRSTCKNCGKERIRIVRSYVGYGSSHGTIKRARVLCPICRKGCYEWRYDNAPGFMERWKRTCCNCGINIDEWKRLKGIRK